jgi:hypothetical protein
MMYAALALQWQQLADEIEKQKAEVILGKSGTRVFDTRVLTRTIPYKTITGSAPSIRRRWLRVL